MSQQSAVSSTVNTEKYHITTVPEVFYHISQNNLYSRENYLTEVKKTVDGCKQFILHTD